MLVKDTLHNSSFNLSIFSHYIIKQLSNNFFDDPTSTSLTCVQSGPINTAGISTSPAGEEVFETNRNLFFKKIRIQRVFDKESNSLIYTSFSTRLDKSADQNKARFKSSLCAVHINNP